LTIEDWGLAIRSFDLPAALRPTLAGLRTGSVKVTLRVNLRLQRGNGSSFAEDLPDNEVGMRVVEVISSCAHSLVGLVYPSLSGCFVVGFGRDGFGDGGDLCGPAVIAFADGGG